MALPPGLRGFVMAQQQGDQRQANQLGMLSQIMQLQGSMQDRQLRQQMMPLQMEQLRAAIDASKTKAQREQAMLGARAELFGGTQPALGALQAGAAEGDIGPTVTNAERIPRQGGFQLNPAAVSRYLALGGDPKTIDAISNLGPMGKLSKIDPKDYTPDSFAKFAQTGDPTALRPRTKMEVTPGGQVFNPYEVAPGQVFADPNKPFSLNPAGGVTPNLPFQGYEIKKAREGRSSTTVNVDTGAKPFWQEFGKGQAEALNKGQVSAKESIEIINTVNEGKKILNSGMITGFGAEALVTMGQALKQAGIDFGGDATANAQAYSANMAQNVGKLIKQFGSGTGLSNADREYAEKMAGGKITLDAQAIRKILDINERAARAVIRNYNKQADAVERSPNAGFMPYSVKVEEPPEVKGNVLDALPKATPANRGMKIRDTQTGEILQSDGMTWKKAK